jgi:hypothetical protein
MSHRVNVQTEFKDRVLLEKACAALGLKAPVQGKHKLWGSQTVDGLGFWPRGWHYPCVVDLTTGQVSTDADARRAGQKAFDEVVCRYAEEGALAYVQEQGYFISEREVLTDGSIRMRVPVL